MIALIALILAGMAGATSAQLWHLHTLNVRNQAELARLLHWLEHRISGVERHVYGIAAPRLADYEDELEIRE